MRVSAIDVSGKVPRSLSYRFADLADRIVEYATRDQAQQAVNTLSNQNLMGRLVYVREVRRSDAGRPPDTDPRACS